MRSIHARMLRSMLHDLSSERLRQEVDVLHQVLGGSWLPLGARKAFIDLCARLRELIEQAQQSNDEIHAMLVASFSRLNSEFRRMLISRLRVVFETISNDIELWNKTASAQVDSQLRERRRNFKRRYESLDRIQSASNELDTRLQEVQAQDERVLQLQTRLQTLMD